jgi:translocator protein
MRQSTMTYAFFRILRIDASAPGRTAAIVAFVMQMALNAAWSFAFFAARNPLFGLLVIIPLEILIVTLIVLFARLDRVSAVCVWPYAAWVGFATLLNASILALNP